MRAKTRRVASRRPAHSFRSTARIRKLCYGLDDTYLEPIEITKRVINGVYQGVTTVELDNLAAEVRSPCLRPFPCSLSELTASRVQTAAYLTTRSVCPGLFRPQHALTLDRRHPDYAILAARIAISNLHKETKKTFSSVVHDLYHYGRSRLRPLISPRRVR